MRLAMRPLAVIAATLAAGLASAARAELVATVEVGTGSSLSRLQFDFSNGHSYLYLVHWESETTGRGLFDIVAAERPDFAFVTETFPFGEALFSVTIGDDFDAGFGTPPEYLDYWHYWVRDTTDDPWSYASSGFAERVVTNGSWDGWVFGSDFEPAVVPGAPTLALLALGLRAAGRRSRRP